MKKTAALLLCTLVATSAHALKIESARSVAGIQQITLNVMNERLQYGDVESLCTLYDKRNRIIDTAGVTFDAPRVNLHFKGDYRRVTRVSCAFEI